jgi:hypothetical protein
MENLNVTETLKETVNSDSAMKTWLVNYVGEQCDPKDDKVTVEMIVETMAKEFPELTHISQRKLQKYGHILFRSRYTCLD